MFSPDISLLDTSTAYHLQVINGRGTATLWDVFWLVFRSMTLEDGTFDNEELERSLDSTTAGVECPAKLHQRYGNSF